MRTTTSLLSSAAVSPSAGTPLSLPGLLTGALLFAGLGGCLYENLSGEGGQLLLAAGLAAIVLFCLAGRLRWFAIGTLAVAAVFLAVSIFFLDLPGGLCCLFNHLSDLLGSHLGRNLLLLEDNPQALFIAELWLALLLAALCVWIVWSGAASAGWVIGLILLALQLIFGIRPPFFWFLLYLGGLLLMRLPASVRIRQTRAGSLTWLLLFTGGAGAAALCLLVLQGQTPSAVVSAHDGLVKQWSDFRFASGTETGLPEGDFTDLGSLVESDTSMLEVTMENPDSYYLRGFVGSTYSSDGWAKADPVSLYDGAELFYWMHQEDFYGTTQLARTASLLAENNDPLLPHLMDISHTGAKRDIVYAPYELTSAGDLLDPAGIGDVTVASDGFWGSGSYTLSAASNQVKRYATLSAALKEADDAGAEGTLADYLTMESYYNRFVYRHFLDIPDALRETLEQLPELAQAAKDAGITPGSSGGASSGSKDENTAGGSAGRLSYTDAKQLVLSWLNDHIQYAEVIPDRDMEQDFLTEFLTDTQAGYDVHYASAAVMMMRFLGIPARYVEGYLITPDAAADAIAGEPIVLTEQDAHAWAEIYQDGIGWIPFEVTPKYLNVMEQEDLLHGTGTSEYRTGNSPNQDTPEENSLEMEEDLHDDPEEEEAREEEEESITSIVRLAAMAGALILLVLLLLLLGSRLIRKIQKYRSFRLPDRDEACRNLYRELHRLMGVTYHWPDCVMPSWFSTNISEDQGRDMAASYDEVIQICEQAAFSSHPVEEVEYERVYQYVRQARKLMKKRLSPGRRIRMLLEV